MKKLKEIQFKAVGGGVFEVYRNDVKLDGSHNREYKAQERITNLQLNEPDEFFHYEQSLKVECFPTFEEIEIESAPSDEDGGSTDDSTNEEDSSNDDTSTDDPNNEFEDEQEFDDSVDGIEDENTNEDEIEGQFYVVAESETGIFKTQQ